MVGYKELNESGEFVIPGFVKMSVVNKPAAEARSGINPNTKEPMEFVAKPASKTVKASPFEFQGRRGALGSFRRFGAKRSAKQSTMLHP